MSKPQTARPITTCLILTALAFTATATSATPYDVTWVSPSPNASGSMPLGNGDIALNAWVEPSGDLRFYISKTDAWSDNARLLKVGRLRVHLEPSPLTEGTPFQQTLTLEQGTMVVSIGEAPNQTTLQLWVDANHPVIHVDVDSPTPVTATASIELWRNEPYELPSIETSDVNLDRSKPNSMHAPTIVEPDVVLTDQKDRIGWYHHNKKSVGPAFMAKIQGLDGFDRPDPLLHRTFGAIVNGENTKRLDDLNLQSTSGKKHRFNVYVLTEHPASPAEWLAAVKSLISLVEQQPFQDRLAAHRDWWQQFWQRSWIHVTRSREAELAPSLPANDHPVKIGVDQNGGSRFRGELGPIHLNSRAYTAQEVATRFEAGRNRSAPNPEGLILTWNDKDERVFDTSKADLTRSLTIETWICPTEKENGRIVDKITVGVDDGFLLDTWPGLGLRLIAGDVVLTAKDCLQPEHWHHVVAIVDPHKGAVQLWLDGKLIAEAGIEGGNDAAVVSQAYALQRFIDACAGRGRFPIKFNGSIFTVPFEGKPGDADYRRWGPGYWWQNTRLPYLSMCASGDFEMMRPLFKMYGEDLLPLCTYRTRHYFGHEGAYIPECIMFWGDVFSETYGWTPFDQRGDDKLQTSGWHKWEWVSGPELVWMMLDYYEHTLDETMLQKTLLPAAHEFLTFFDQNYDVDANGKLVMYPSQAVETWWDCTNPMPELAGLHAVTNRLLNLPESLTTPKQRAFWKQLADKLPPLPTREVDSVRMLAPAERFENKRNIENPELYAVFPFRLFAIDKPDIDLAIEALHHRWNRGHFGWRQDDIFMAYLGLADDARQNLVKRAKRKDANSRFPAFWGPNYDWVPDQDHGAVLMKALQSMAMQTDGHKIYLLPAWPEHWNLSFKLHAPQKTTVELTYNNGQIQSLKVTPPSRRQDIVIPQ